MRILITGGAGFIGSHTVDLLAVSGHRVTVYDNLTSGSARNLSKCMPAIELVQGDTRDIRRLSRVVARGKFDGILHLAAIASVATAVRFPRHCQEVNVGGTLNVLEVARKHGVRRVVIASSAAVYGNPKSVPCSETALPAPLSQYGVHKLMGEHYARAYSHLYGLETVCLRYFNVYGPRQVASSPYSGVISRFLDIVLKGGVPEIHGDGRQTRDFVFVLDVARANIAALFKDSSGPLVVNVGTGRETSIRELYGALCKLLDKEPELALAEARPGDIRRSRADIRQLQRHLHDRPSVPLDVGLRIAIKALIEDATQGSAHTGHEPSPVLPAATHRGLEKVYAQLADA